MRGLACMICAWLVVGHSHAQPVITPQVFIPSPAGVLISVGMWIYDASTKKQVYFVEVRGQGTTPTEARNNGFRLAVESALGTLISSETEVANGRIVRDEIISYAAGFVDRFEIVNTQTTAQGSEVTMRVWVGRSALANRLLNRTEQSGQVDGARASVQLQTLNQERETGDALLQQVLNDFPKRAFDIELKHTDVVRQNRSAMIEINFKLRWNKDYLRSIWTALEATSQRTSRPVVTITVQGGGWFGGFGGAAKFDDNRKFLLLADRMYAQAPTVLVTIRGAHRQVLFQSCYMYQELDNIAHYNITTQRFVEFDASGARLNGGFTMIGRIPIPVSAEILSNSSSIDMDIVLRQQCPNR